MKSVFLVLAASLLAPGFVFGDISSAKFQNPSGPAAPKVWWHWMNGNVSREGITRDLEAMKAAGIGGTQIFEVFCGMPPGPVVPGSKEWLDRVVFAVQESARLGLTIGLHNAPGWAGTGGPWITPQNSMQMLTWSEARIPGGQKVQMRLPEPFRRENFYKDIAVFAFPAPPGDMQDMRASRPEAKTGEDAPADKAIDGLWDTTVPLGKPAPGHPATLTLSFPEPFAARAITVIPSAWQPWKGELQASDDGQTFRKIRDIKIPDHAVVQYPYCCNFPETKARHFRLVVHDAGRDRDQSAKIAEFELLGGSRIDDFYGKTGNVVNDHPQPADPLPGSDIAPASILDLTKNMAPDGQLTWEAPPGDWIVVRMGHTTTGIAGREAPPGSDGLQCDKLSKEAVDAHWNHMLKPLLDSIEAAGKARLDSVAVDSWEVGTQNWTPNFREEFRSRRGYDLAAYWPALTGRIVQSQAVTMRFYRDIRRTIADLIADNYYGHLHQRAKEAGLQLAAEAYGNGNFDWFECAGRADIPMTEFHVDGKPEVGFHEKFAASPAHVYGRAIVAAEAFTAFPSPTTGRWLDYPGSMKIVGDNKAFCGGINQFYFHRFAHNPWPQFKPGMTMGMYGIHYEGTQTWWDQATAWNKYLSRCQYLLQQGQFVADICYYHNEQSALANRDNLNPRPPDGYDFDGCATDALLTMDFKDGRLVFPSGMSYRYLVILDAREIPLGVVRKVRELIAKGATVLFTSRPTLDPGLQDYPSCDQEIQKLVQEVWGNIDGKTVTENRFGNGRVVFGETLDKIAGADGLVPDFSHDLSDGRKLNYIHRRTSNSEIYFVANPKTEPVSAECRFRVTGMVPELWNPESGATEPAPVWREEDGQTVVQLSMESAGSIFVIFRRNPVPPAHFANWIESPPAAKDGSPATAIQSTPTGMRTDFWRDGTARAALPGGAKVQERAVQNVPPPVEIRGPWDVQFDPQWARGGASEAPVGKDGLVVFDRLEDWSIRPELGIRYYSGTAAYRADFTVPEEWIKDARKILLDLGRVEVMAHVTINGKDAGVLWKAPFRRDVTPFVTPGRNSLEVNVVNLWPNRLIGDEQFPDDCEWSGKVIKKWPDWLLKGEARPGQRLSFTTYKHWPKGSALLPSGLLGPVLLRASTPVVWTADEN